MSAALCAALAVASCGGASPAVTGSAPGHTMERARPESPPAPSGPLAARITTASVSLAGHQLGRDEYLAALLYLASAPDGGVRVGWVEGDTSYVRTLDRALQPVGVDLALPGVVIDGMIATPDGGLLLAGFPPPTPGNLANAFEEPLQLLAIRIGADGRERFRTPIVGGHGTGVGATWHAWGPSHAVALASTGTQHVVYAAISKHFADAGTHQGDLYVVLDDHGTIDPARTAEWSVSHSNQLFALRGATGDWLTLTVGDAYPIGVVLRDRDHGKGDHILWPPAELGVTKDQMVSVVDAGYLCGAIARGGRVFATMGTSRKGHTDYSREDADVLLVSADEQGGAIERRWLTETRATTEPCPQLLPQGDGMLAIWSAAPEPDGTYHDDEPTRTATLLELAADGSPRGAPLVTAQPFESSTPSITLDDGTVVWATAAYHGDSVDLVRVAP